MSVLGGKSIFMIKILEGKGISEQNEFPKIPLWWLYIGTDYKSHFFDLGFISRNFLL
jgi:hypothetical protein